MNLRLLVAVPALGCLAAWSQEPPTPSSRKPARIAASAKTSPPKTEFTDRTLDLRRSKRPSEPASRNDPMMPLIASPVFVPQTAGPAAPAMISSQGYLYVVSGDTLFKVSERTMKVVQSVALRGPIAKTTSASLRRDPVRSTKPARRGAGKSKGSVSESSSER